MGDQHAVPARVRRRVVQVGEAEVRVVEENVVVGSEVAGVQAARVHAVHDCDMRQGAQRAQLSRHLGRIESRLGEPAPSAGGVSWADKEPGTIIEPEDDPEMERTETPGPLEAPPVAAASTRISRQPGFAHAAAPSAAGAPVSVE